MGSLEIIQSMLNVRITSYFETTLYLQLQLVYYVMMYSVNFVCHNSHGNFGLLLKSSHSITC